LEDGIIRELRFTLQEIDCELAVGTEPRRHHDISALIPGQRLISSPSTSAPRTCPRGNSLKAAATRGTRGAAEPPIVFIQHPLLRHISSCFQALTSNTQNVLEINFVMKCLGNTDFTILARVITKPALRPQQHKNTGNGTMLKLVHRSWPPVVLAIGFIATLAWLGFFGFALFKLTRVVF
jgi:hypothetical protein